MKQKIKNIMFIVLIIAIIVWIVVSFIVVLIKKNSNSWGGGLYGDTVEEKLWWAMKDAGFNDIQIASMMGNIYQESKFDPTAHNPNGNGLGLCGWLYAYLGDDLVRYAIDKGEKVNKVDIWPSAETQIEFILAWHARTGPAVEYVSESKGPLEGKGLAYFGVYYNKGEWLNYKETGNVDADIDYCTIAYCANYERCREDEMMPDVRKNAAKGYYKQFHGQSKPANLTSGSGSEISINNSDYVLVGHTQEAYKVIQDKGYCQSSMGNTDGCLGFSYVYTYAVYTGRMDKLESGKEPYPANTDTNGVFAEKTNKNKDILVREIFDNLQKGKPCILQVVGSRSKKGRHYVSVVGYKKGKTKSTIKDTDLLILDVYDGVLKAVAEEDSSSGRYMLDAHKFNPSNPIYNYNYQYYYLK